MPVASAYTNPNVDKYEAVHPWVSIRSGQWRRFDRPPPNPTDTTAH